MGKIIHGLWKSDKKKYMKLWRDSHKERYKEYRKIHRKKVRMQVMFHYGGNPPKCACCGEINIEFLVLDHIHGGGLKHRKMVGGPDKVYTWIIKHNYPEGYRILCSNCNHSFGRYGYCPHQNGKNNTNFIREKNQVISVD